MRVRMCVCGGEATVCAAAHLLESALVGFSFESCREVRHVRKDVEVRRLLVFVLVTTGLHELRIQLTNKARPLVVVVVVVVARGR